MKNFFAALLLLAMSSAAWCAGGTGVRLSWTADSTATGGYNIYRGTVHSGPYTKIGSAASTATAYDDTTTAPNTAYYYVVTAIDTASPPNESAYSTEVTATELIPGTLSASVVSTGITLTWTSDASATGGYNVYRGTVSGGTYTKLGSVAADVLTYTDTTATAGTAYYYVVSGVDTGSPVDESAYSNEVTAQRAALPSAPTGLKAVTQ